MNYILIICICKIIFIIINCFSFFPLLKSKFQAQKNNDNENNILVSVAQQVKQCMC